MLSFPNVGWSVWQCHIKYARINSGRYLRRPEEMCNGSTIQCKHRTMEAPYNGNSIYGNSIQGKIHTMETPSNESKIQWKHYTMEALYNGSIIQWPMFFNWNSYCCYLQNWSTFVKLPQSENFYAWSPKFSKIVHIDNTQALTHKN